ncbi:MAG: hypothetical protein M1830_008588 [Pleopsidium flavum]|nr:MAG: hypothetical protein M1830_008588 [Pleopsidium flavum]
MSSLFSKLPPEIRNRIYDFTLCVDGEICPIGLGIHNRWQHTDPAPNNFSIGGSILRTSKQIHNEAVPILYGKNHFIFIDGPTPLFSTSWDMVGMYAFFVIIGRKNRMSIRYLTTQLTKLSGASYHAYARNARELGDSFELLSLGHNLKSLRIDFGDGTWTRDRSTYWNFFTGKKVIENLRKIKGVESFEILGDIDKMHTVYGTKHEDRVQELMKFMEVGRARQADPQRQVRLTLTPPKTVGRKISERLLVLEAEREELKATVAALSSQMEEMEKMGKLLPRLEALHEKVDSLAECI